MKIAQRCPVCQGSGNVPGGFYNVCAGHTESLSSTSVMEKCRSCINGIIYVDQVETIDQCNHLMVREVGDIFELNAKCIKCGHVQ